AGSWLLLSVSDAADLLTAGLAEALTAQGARSTTVSWPVGAGNLVDVTPLGNAMQVLTGVVVVTAPPDGEPRERLTRRGQDHVAHLVGIARELAELPGDAPRLCVV